MTTKSSIDLSQLLKWSTICFDFWLIQSGKLGTSAISAQLWGP